MDDLLNSKKLRGKKGVINQKHLPFSLKNFKNRFGKQETTTKEQRDKYLKDMKKHNQFLSKKYIDNIRADFTQKLNKNSEKKFKKNIRYQGISPDSKFPLSNANVKLMNYSAQKSSKLKVYNQVLEGSPATKQPNRKTVSKKLESKNDIISQDALTSGRGR